MGHVRASAGLPNSPLSLPGAPNTNARTYAEALSKVEHGLHLVPDQKFQNSRVSILDKLPGQNVFQCLLGRSVEDNTV